MFTCSGDAEGSGSSDGVSVTMLSLEPAEGRAYGSASGLGFIRVAISTAATTSTTVTARVMRAILSFLFISDLQAPPGALSTHYDSIERMKLQIF